MKKLIQITLCLLVIGLGGPLPSQAADDLKAADAAYDQGGMQNLAKAVDLYTRAAEANPDNYEIAWKSGRAHRMYGKTAKELDMDGWKALCAQYGKSGMAYAQKAISLKPKGVEGHYYYGLSVGTYSDGVSILTALKEGLKKKTQASFEKAYDINKLYNDAGPMLSLGRFWTVLPWPLYNLEKALAYLREYQATPYFEGSAEAHVYLAELLRKIGGGKNKKEARELLEKAANSSDKYFSDWAKRLLK